MSVSYCSNIPEVIPGIVHVERQACMTYLGDLKSVGSVIFRNRCACYELKIGSLVNILVDLECRVILADFGLGPVV